MSWALIMRLQIMSTKTMLLREAADNQSEQSTPQGRPEVLTLFRAYTSTLGCGVCPIATASRKSTCNTPTQPLVLCVGTEACMW